MEIKIRQAVEADIVALKDRLREADEKEIIAAGNENAEYALKNSFAKSLLSYTLDIDGVPACMFGIVPESLLGDTAAVWFLGTNEMSRIKKSFVRISRRVIAFFLAQYPTLWNDVDGRYASSIRWLKSCGAQFSDTPIKLGGVDFYRFIIRRA